MYTYNLIRLGLILGKSVLTTLGVLLRCVFMEARVVCYILFHNYCAKLCHYGGSVLLLAFNVCLSSTQISAMCLGTVVAGYTYGCL